MGIRNLTRWIQWIHPPQLLDADGWQQYRGKRIGIDALSVLYKARQDRQHLLQSLHDLLTFWEDAGVVPIFIFDGRTPREKDGTRSARRRQKARLSDEDQTRLHVTSEDRNEVKQLLYARGILAVNAEEEADSVLAYLARRGDLAAVVSTDMDFLPRGVETLLLPTDLQSPTTWRVIHRPALLEKARLTPPQFLDLCVLLGCDYAPTLPTVSYQSAYWRLRSRETMLEILEGEGIRTATAWLHARELLLGTRDTWETILSERQREKWAAGAPPKEPEAEILRGLAAIQ